MCLDKMKHTLFGPFIFFKTCNLKNLQFHLQCNIYTFLAFQVLILEFFNCGIGSTRMIHQPLLLYGDPFGTDVLKDNLFVSQGNEIFTNPFGFIIFDACC
jgi:hypothetical protein